MILSSSYDSLLFPMTADIFYAAERQADYGNIVREWVYDRTVMCSAISIDANSVAEAEVKFNRGIANIESNVNFRTNEDIRKSSSGKYYPVTAIIIANMKDPAGNPAWQNTENLKSRPGTTMTKYEVKTVITSFDENHNVGMYRVYLSRSANQKWGDEV